LLIGVIIGSILVFSFRTSKNKQTYTGREENKDN
jgi:hypothetical protein